MDLYAVLDPDGKLVLSTPSNRSSVYVLRDFGRVRDANRVLDDAGYTRLSPWDTTEEHQFALVVRRAA